MRALTLSRSGIFYSSASVEMRLLQEKVYAEKIYKIKTERADFTVSTLLAQLLSIQVGEKVDSGALEKSIKDTTAAYREGVEMLLGRSRALKASSPQEKYKKAHNEKRKKFLKDTVTSEEAFTSLDAIMQKIVNL